LPTDGISAALSPETSARTFAGEKMIGNMAVSMSLALWTFAVIGSTASAAVASLKAFE
jgi:hypothetical protein